MSKKPRVLLDCDGVLGDFITPALQVIEDLCGINVEHDDVSVWDFAEQYLESEADRAEYWRRVTAPGFCASIEPYPIAREGVALLQSYADVYVVTSPMATGKTWMHERQEWCREHFGLHYKHVIHTHAKYTVSGAMLVDDKPEHVERWQAEQPGRVGVLWERRYNAHATHLRSTRHWGAVVDMLQSAMRGAA